MGLHGCSNVGKDVVRLLQPWNCQILAHDIRDYAVLINTCRGGIVDGSALKERLLDGRLAAACVDAFAVKTPTDDELLNAPNFLCTPHIGSSSAEARLAMGRAAIDGIEDNFLPEPGVFPFD